MQNQKQYFRQTITVLMACGLIASLLPGRAAAQDPSTFYVGGGGASDHNPGTASAPFATIQKAAAVATAGSTVKIRTGTYRETIIPAHSGSEGNPVVFEPDGNAVVTVSGADTADGGWTQHDGDIYKKTISMTKGYNAYMTDNTTLMANQVFVSGEMMIEARWPNISGENDLLERKSFRRCHEDPKIVHPAQAAWSTNDGMQTLTDPGIPDITGGWTGGTIWINGWYVSQTRDIAAHSGSTLTISGNILDSEKFRRFYYVTGVLGALDTEREFFYDGAHLYLWQPGGGSPANVEVKRRNFAFDLRGKSHITITNIKIFAASIITNPDSEKITLDGINAKYINHAVTLTDRDVIYSRTGQSDRGQQRNSEQATGIRLMGAGSIIKNSVVSFSSSMGIVLGENCTAYNNLVHDINYEGSYASAIVPYSGASGQKILNNTIYRTGRSCIDLMDSQDMEIGYNDMYHFGMLNIDMGGIYSARSHLQTGSRIHHNWIHDSKAISDPDGGNGIQVGIYFDQCTGNLQVDHNVLWNNLQADYYVEQKRPERASAIYNNTFATTNGRRSYLNSTDKANPIHDMMKNNIFRERVEINRSEATPSGANSLYRTQDPLFVNEGAGGLAYRIRSDSPARDAGAVIPGVTDGYVGSAPDIGAYEYGGKDWVAGCTLPDKRLNTTKQ
jgi:hypothetical protein